MDEHDFAQRFGALYRELYRLAVRRVDDGRDVLAPETTALLLHLAQAGPLSLSELAQHLGRALSTLSTKVAELESQRLLARQRDEQDARRALIWLTALGRQTLLDALDVLDTPRIAGAAARLDPARRTRLVEDLEALLGAIPPPDGERR